MTHCLKLTADAELNVTKYKNIYILFLRLCLNIILDQIET